jgi:holo-[acyl-carrier protein] synthase
MTIRLGTDIVYIPRIRALIDRFEKRFLQRVYTPIEQQNCGCREEEMTPMAIAKLAGRWAAKEAVVKALGTGWQGINYTDVEICRTPAGVPFPVLYNNAAEIVARWGVEGKGEREKGNAKFPLPFGNRILLRPSKLRQSKPCYGNTKRVQRGVDEQNDVPPHVTALTIPNSQCPNHEWQLSLSHDRDYAIATAIFVAS